MTTLVDPLVCLSHRESPEDGAPLCGAWLSEHCVLCGLCPGLHADGCDGRDDAGLPLRTVPVPGADGSLLERVNAIRANRDIEDAAREREINPPTRRIVRNTGNPSLDEYALIEPNACRYCDIGKRSHVSLWSPLVGWHTWVEPTDRMRLARMRARRSATYSTKEG